ALDVTLDVFIRREHCGLTGRGACQHDCDSLSGNQFPKATKGDAGDLLRRLRRQNRTIHLPHDSQTFNILSQSFVRAFALGDIRDASPYQVRLSARQAHQTDLALNILARRIAMDPLEDWRAAVKRLSNLFGRQFAGRTTVGRYRVAYINRTQLKKFLSLKPEELNGVFIRINEPAGVRVHNKDRFGRTFYQGSISLLTHSQRLLYPLEIGEFRAQPLLTALVFTSDDLRIVAEEVCQARLFPDECGEPLPRRLIGLIRNLWVSLDPQVGHLDVGEKPDQVGVIDRA